MEKLIAQLMRLYAPAGALSPQALADYLLGRQAAPELVTDDGLTRCVVVPFDKSGAGADAWTRLCEAAHALQAAHGLPAPAVSIDGEHGFCLWIALAAPIPAVQAARFVQRVHAAWSPGVDLRPDAVLPPPLPPCLNPRTGKWAAFIHPGMGASFAEEPGLELAPPPAAQAAFLEDLETVELAQFERVAEALAPVPQPALQPVLQPVQAAAVAVLPAAQGSLPAQAGAPDGLLLKDATLEDIVRFLHARNIEPSFRFILPGGK